MAVGTAQATAPGEDRHSSDTLIDKQLSRVRRHIRFTDLVASAMTLMAGVLGYLILIAIFDHWILGLGFWGRLAALVTLVGGSAWYVATRLVPVLIRHINPAFAAQTIERSEPSLKNSVLNYLLLRRERPAMHELVYKALQQRAASDVSHVAVEQTVDRSGLINAGYVLIAMMVVTAAYKILSPKDPMQTVRRVLSPWAELARPARVTIKDVEPGDAEFFHGQTCNVSAIVRGVRDSERVRLLYSTADGQTIDREAVMKLDSSGLRHLAQLPPDPNGLKQDLIYRVVAGDCTTRDFHIRAVAAPTIQVATVEYEYPAYTKRPREIIEHQGDIKALEGTRVTIRGRANQPIRTATLEFDPPAPITTADGQPTPAPEHLSMEFKDADAWRSFVLELAGDRRSPKHAKYQLTFVNTAGHGSTQPVVHRIDVTPDLAPEVEIITPRRERIEVPVSGRQKIEVRAIDPDYGLTQLKLKALHGNSELLDKSLLDAAEAQTGQVMVTFDFSPKELGLEAGSEVTYWAAAEDNRVAVGSESPEPNSTRTSNYHIIVVPDPPPSRAQSEKPENDEGGKTDTSPDAKSSPSKIPTKKPSPSANDKKRPDQQKKSDSKSDNQKGQGQQNDQPSKSQQGEDQGQEGSPSGDNKQGNQQGGGSSAQTGNAQPQPGQGSEGQQSGGNTPQENGQGATGTSPGKNSDGSGQYREGQDSGKRTEPLHDGEVFDKALQRIKQDKQQSPEPNNEPSDTGSGTGQSKAKKGEPGEPNESLKPSSETGTDDNKQSQKKDGENQPGKSESPPDGKSASKAKSQSGGGAKQPDQNEGEGQAREGASGEGGKSARGGQERPEKASGTEKKQPQDGDKKPGLGDNGQAGAGQNSKDKSGSGSTEQAEGEEVKNQDRPKTLEPNSQQPQEPDDPVATTSKKQSDSQGAQTGDQSGGGKKGPGQGAKQAGNDSAGTNSSSDDGAGNSQEKGKGDTSSSAGESQKSQTPTGSAGSQTGPGSQSTSSPKGQQAGGQNDPSARQTPPQGDGQQPPPNDNPAKGSGANAAGSESPGGGTPGNRPAGAPPPNADVPDGDAVNLDYARRATDMVLEYLRDQQDKPDQRLLDEMGWTADDLKAFLDRWQKLKQSAVEDSNVRRELDESLRSLGLQPRKDTKRTGGPRSDDQRGLRESGIKSDPPPAYQEQFKAFKKGASRAAPSK